MAVVGGFLKEVRMLHMDASNEPIPAGWQIMDGTTLLAGTHDIGGGASSYTVADMRNRFPLGADPTKGAGLSGGVTNSATDAPGPKGTGGLHSKTLSTTEIPGHTHTFTTGSAGAHAHAGSTADSGGSHIHTASTSSAGSHNHAGSITTTDGNHTHSMDATPQIGGPVSSGLVSTPGNAGFSTNAAGSHNHSLSITSDGTHTHTITVNSGGAHTHSLTLASDGAHTHTGTTDSTGGGTAWDTRPRFYGLVFLIKVKI